MNHRSYGLVLMAALGATTTALSSDREADRARRRTPVVEAYERARESVVNIAASEKVEVQRWGTNMFGDLFPIPLEQNTRSAGSGFVLHEDGYIVTNAHVVSVGSQLSVILVDGKEYEARIIGRDTTRDLAVIKIEPDAPLVPIPLGRSDDLMIGEQTIAIGNPVGLHNTVTTGVVSALHRELDVQGRSIYRDVIQTDASINPGNSGGPLLNALGELIGINTAIRTDAQNIGFAIPVDQLREILPEVLDSEKLNKVTLGLRVSGGDPPAVLEVREASPASKAGVRTGDVIEAIDGKKLRRGVDYHVAMLSRPAGTTTTFTLFRGSKSVQVSVTPEDVPKPDGKRLALKTLGATVEDAKAEVAKRFQLRRSAGVIVLGVESKSPADQAGLRPGDLLVSMGRYWLTGVDQVGALLSEVAPGDPIDISFRREQRGQIYERESRLYAR